MTDAPPSLTRPFWDAATEGRLVRPVCDRCGHNFFTPSWCCPSCGSDSWAYKQSEGFGQVYSHTTVHRGPDADWPVPYVLGIVDLTEGWSMLSRILVAPPDDDDDPGSLIGLPVAVTFMREGRLPHRSLPVFAPREERA